MASVIVGNPRPSMPAVTCPHHPACPGCPLLGLSPDEQLRNKRETVVRALGSHAELDGCVPANIVGARALVDYRVRAKLVASQKKLGLFRASTHQLVDIPECRVLTPELRMLAQSLRGALPADVTAVDLRATDEGALVTLIVRRGASPEQLTELARGLAERVEGIAGIALGFRDPDSPQLLGDEPVLVSGAAELPHHFDPEAPFHYAAHGAFTQVHPEQAARLHALVERSLEGWLGGLQGVRVLELHAGSGLLGLRLARSGAKPTLVEAYEPAVLRARQAAREQGLSIDAYRDEAESFCERVLRDRERFDAVLVNPPRRGLEPGLRASIAALGARALVYVSCSPRTFARDAAHFARLGYRTRRVTPFDLIPLSDAVEVVAELVRDGAPDVRVLHADQELIAVEKSGHESMRELSARVRRLEGGAEAVPLQQLDASVSGVCVFACRAEHEQRLRASLEAGETRYVGLARGITREKGSMRRGSSARIRYVRRRVHAGHSLLDLVPESHAPRAIGKHLAGIGHPLIGDARDGDARTNAYFWHRHGLDRAFLHLESVRLERDAGPLELRSELASDLRAVLES